MGDSHTASSQSQRSLLRLVSLGVIKKPFTFDHHYYTNILLLNVTIATIEAKCNSIPFAIFDDPSII